MAIGAWAGWAQTTQVDTAFVPFIVNVDATVKATPGVSGGGLEPVEITVTAGEEAVLRLPIPKTNGVSFFGTQRQSNAPAIISNRGGKITLNLPAQSYKNAEVLLYTVNGKRILRDNVSALSAVNTISRPNVATGVYLLSVRGANGDAVTSRLTHSGGGININAVFGSGSERLSATSQLAKKASETGEWDITVSAVADGWKDSVFTIQPNKGNNPLKSITLKEKPQDPPEVEKGTFTDERDGTTYKKITLTSAKLGSVTWMAENLNIEAGNSWCYDNKPDNCTKYGRLYDWQTAKTVCPSGWHLPSRQEWDDLVTAAGGSSVAGKKLKSTSGWNTYSGSITATDEFAFSALPGGYRHPNGTFDYVGRSGFWWTATEDLSGNADDRYMRYYDDDVIEDNYYKGGGFSVRCLQD